MDPVELRDALTANLTREQLEVLCLDLQSALGRVAPATRIRVRLGDLGGDGLEAETLVARLINKLERYGQLDVLLELLRQPKHRHLLTSLDEAPHADSLDAVLTKSVFPDSGVPEDERALQPATSARPVLATPTLRLREVPTSIYELLPRDGWSLVSVELVNQQRSKFSGSVRAQIDRFSDPDVRKIDLGPREGATVALHPVLRRTQVDTLHEAEPVTLHVQVNALGNHTVSDETVRLGLLPRTAAMLSVRDHITGAWRDLRPYLGGYVTPQAAAVQAFLDRVRRHAPAGMLLGHGGGSPADVVPRVRAVFEALKELGVGYAQSTFVFNQNADWSRQRLRLPSETLATRIANCLDGAVLVASLLEAFSVSSALVFTGTADGAHAFVAWEAVRGSNRWSHLETNDFVGMTFEEARSSADARASAFDDEGVATRTPIFSRLAIRDLRAQGINPLQ